MTEPRKEGHGLREKRRDDRYALARLRQRVGVLQLLSHYGLDQDLRLHRGELVGPCPLPGHAGDRSNRGAFRIHPQRGLWHCFTHCGGGDTVALVALMEGGDFAKAARILVCLEGAAAPTPPGSRATCAGAAEGFRPYVRKLKLDARHPLLLERGILPATAEHFEVGGWSLGGFLEGCVGVRLHDPQGRPLGYTGRRLDAAEAHRHGKWKLPPRLPKHRLLYGWHRARRHLEQGLVLVEGPFDAMRVWQIGHRAVVALLGTTLSAAQHDLLVTTPSVVALLDGDESGRRATMRLLRSMRSRVRPIRLSDGQDPADLSDHELRSILLEEGLAL